jgi:hypothetical protein
MEIFCIEAKDQELMCDTHTYLTRKCENLNLHMELRSILGKLSISVI